MQASVRSAVKNTTNNKKKSSRAVINRNTRKGKSKIGRLTLAQPLLTIRKEREAGRSCAMASAMPMQRLKHLQAEKSVLAIKTIHHTNRTAAFIETSGCSRYFAFAFYDLIGCFCRKHMLLQILAG